MGAPLNTRQAAELAGLKTPASFRAFAARQARAGNPLTLPEEQWPDRRTPQYDEEKLRAALAKRSNRGPRRAAEVAEPGGNS